MCPEGMFWVFFFVCVLHLMKQMNLDLGIGFSFTWKSHVNHSSKNQLPFSSSVFVSHLKYMYISYWIKRPVKSQRGKKAI